LRAGAKVGLGSDLADLRFLPLQGGELVLRGEVQKPIDVLRAATSVNAADLRASEALGCIRAGAYADLLVLAGNPLEDLTLFTRDSDMPVVMRNGQFIRNLL
jgi:imidazolonepropionase-like amidohydrolase